jgi:ABC-type transport system substrate-binding protein
MLTNTLPPQIGHPAEITLSSTLYSSYCSPIYQRLFNRSADYSPTPGLVRSWEIAPDKKSITWHLIQGVKFQDGTPFDAAAVKYNLEAQAATTAGKGEL